MCGRYYLEPSSELLPIIERTRRCRLTEKMIIHLGRPLKKDGTVSPDDTVSSFIPSITENKAVIIHRDITEGIPTACRSFGRYVIEHHDILIQPGFLRPQLFIQNIGDHVVNDPLSPSGNAAVLVDQ